MCCILKNIIPKICLLLGLWSALFTHSFAQNDDVDVRVLLSIGGKNIVYIKCRKNLTLKDAFTLNNILQNLKKIKITSKNKSLVVNGALVNTSFVYILTNDFSTPIYLNGKPYRGYFLIGVDEKGKLMAINYVGLEYYLAGVLGGEIISSWPLEAIKAQAVASRTYILYKMQQKKGKLYDVTDNTSDQMYVGVKGESWKFNKAVKDTRGEVLIRNGKIICAYYHSNSGGCTSSSWNVFKQDKGKLIGVKDPFSQNAPNSYWKMVISADKIKRKLTKGGYTIGKIISISPYMKDKAGRVIYLKITHSKGITYVFGTDFRRLIGYRTIKSTNFKVYPKRYIAYKYSKGNASRGKIYTNVHLVNKIPSYFLFKGKGWGHGVGMSQWGAKNMAQMGYNYRQILKYYYPGTKIGKIIAKKP